MTLLCALAMLAASAMGAQFHLPFHSPPSLVRPERPRNLSAGLALGAFHAAAPGLSADGPGGGWELAARAGERSSVHFHSEGFAFHGAADSGAGTRRKTGGLVGNIEADFARPFGESAAGWYVGGLVNTTIMSVADPLSFRVQGGQLRLEPDLATWFVFGVPAGLRWRSAGDGAWGADAAAYVVGWLGGGTLFGYTVGVPGLYGASKPIDPNVAGGAVLGGEYRPWGLGLQAGGGAAAPSGNNDGLVIAWGRVLWRFR